MSMLLICFLFAFLCFLRRQHLSQTRAHREHGDKIPGPKALPLIGNLLQLGFSTKSLFEFMKRTTREYGPVVRIWNGTNLIVFISDPPIIELLLSSYKNINKALVYEFTRTWLGNGLVSNTGATWHKHRKILTPTFHIKILHKFVDVFSSNIDVLIDKLSHVQQGTQINICEWMDLFTLDVICESAMGVKVNAMQERDSDFVNGVHSLLEVIYKRTFRPWLYPNIMFRMSALGRKEAKNLPIVLGMSERIIKTRQKLRRAASSDEPADDNDDIDFMREQPDLRAKEEKKRQLPATHQYEKEAGTRNKSAFLDLLLSHTEGENLTYEEMRDEVNTFLAAGHETTGGCLSYTCWLLAKHQVVQDKVVEELRSIFGNSLQHATIHDLNEMKYLEQVIKESLRLLPAVPLFARKLSEDIVTDKYVLPAGCDVAVFVYMVHRHPDYFPDPEKFDPDRFLAENCVGRHPYCYIPFSAGPRNCIGYKFAMYEMKATLAKLLRHFKILPAENPFLDLDLTAQFTLKSINGVPIRLQHRDFTQQL